MGWGTTSVGNKILQYPDESDPHLWKKLLQRDAFSAYSPETAQIKPSGKLARAENPDDVDQGVLALPSSKAHGTGNDGAEHNFYQVVDWYGPDDPENPHNWSSKWKLLVVFQICLMNFSVYIASSIYVPGESGVRQDFGVSETVSTLGLSIYSLGYGCGPMLWSPVSEIPKLGRNPLGYFWPYLAFVLLQLPTGYAVNMPMLVIFRFLTGFCGSPALATGGATIPDMYDPAYVPYAICIWGSFGICGPVFGPIVGGYIAPLKGWRWTIWFTAWLNALVLLIQFVSFPEASAANILYRRAKRLRKVSGDKRWKSQSEIDAEHQTARDRLLVLGRAFTLTFSEPVIFVLDLYSALLYGVLFTWFESFPLVFGNIYHFTVGEQGLVFLAIFVGGVFAVPMYLLWLRRFIVPKITEPGFKPEMLLPPTFFGAASLPICLFWYGWTARGTIHWIVPLVGSGLFTVSIVTLFNPVLSYLGTAYPPYAASVFAGNALFRASFGAIFPLFARQLFRKLGIGPGNSLLAAISVCFIPLLIIFYKYGAKIRHMSKNARHDV